jgi:hypothetical protein
MIAAGLGQVAPRRYAQFDAQMLEQNCHEVGNHDNSQEGIAELRAARQIGGPIAGIHVTDSDEEPRTGKSPQLPPKRRRRRNDDATMDFRQRNLSSRPAPRRSWCGCERTLVHELRYGFAFKMALLMPTEMGRSFPAKFAANIEVTKSD